MLNREAALPFVDDLKQSHNDILIAIEGIKPKELTRPNTIGSWSVRDVLLHIAMWEGEVLKALAIWRSGNKVDWSYIKDYKGILMYNDFWIKNLTFLSVKKVLNLLDITHKAIIADVASITDKEWRALHGLPKWLRQMTTDHNKKHVQKILAFKKTLEA